MFDFVATTNNKGVMVKHTLEHGKEEGVTHMQVTLSAKS
jgi:hypothetical protein